MDNQVEFIQIQTYHKLNTVHLNLVLCHPNNMELPEICHHNNMELPEICHHNNMELPVICHKANLVILLCKINIHNNHTNIDT